MIFLLVFIKPVTKDRYIFDIFRQKKVIFYKLIIILFKKISSYDKIKMVIICIID